MKIERFVLGAYETNCYVLREDVSAENCLVIDAGLDAKELVEFLKENKLRPAAVVLTHGHIDHIRGIALLREEFPDIKVYIHKLDAKMLLKPLINLSLMTGKFFKTAAADVLLDEADVIEEAGIKLIVYHTPGHTEGGICLYAKEDNIIFTGDTLFADSVGRTDMPGGSMAKLVKSIKEKLCTLGDETIVYPGHGPETTIGREKQYNQFLS